jgi:hypothetical protein
MEYEVLAERSDLDGAQLRERMALKTELLEILDDEEMYWYKRSHETWLLKGDNNTSYFHRVANGKKRKQAIYSLQDGDRNVTGDEELLKHVTEFYKNLFGPGVGDMLTLDPELWAEEDKVTLGENQELTRPFVEEEIKAALFTMEKNKAAGPDGSLIEFY